MPLVVSQKMIDAQEDEKLVEMEHYLNALEEEIMKNESANLASMGIIFGKLQGTYKDVIHLRSLFKKEKDD